MAVKKDSNGYTFGFAIALVVVVGTSLALISQGLKPLQEKNEEVKKKLDILSAMLTSDEMESIDRSNGEENFDKYINLDEAIVIDINGEVKESIKAFDIDIKKDYKDKNLIDANKSFPLFMSEKDGEKLYIIPIVGKGLWGPIWGNICLGSDMKTIVGASFGHKGETPGLGAEIAQPFFVNRWMQEVVSDESGNPVKFEIVKDNSGKENLAKVDGITGGTITSVGVQEMVNRCLKPYVTYFNNLKKD